MKFSWLNIGIIITILFVSWSVSYAQPGFSKGFNFNSTTLFHDVLLKEDTIIIIGTSYDKEEKRWGALFVKMDTMGNVLMHNLILDPNGNEFVFDKENSIIALSDGGYLISGVIHASQRYFIMKIAEDGIMDFIKEYSYTYPEIRSANPHKLAEGGGGYYIIGYYQMEDYKGDVFVRKVDKQGEVLWERLYGMEEGGVYLGSIWVDHKNSINIGAKRSTNVPDPDGGSCIQSWIFNIDSMGEIQQEWHSDPCGGVNVIGIHPTQDDGWVYASEKRKYFMYGQRGFVPMIKKLNGWETTVGYTYALGNWTHDMVRTTLGNYVMGGIGCNLNHSHQTP